jgi:hypothetical protein
VLDIVRVAVAGLVPDRVTGAVEPKLRFGRFVVPSGAEVIKAISETVPVNPLTGDTVTVEVLAEALPDTMVTAVALTVKLGCGGVVTVTELEPLDAL